MCCYSWNNPENIIDVLQIGLNLTLKSYQDNILVFLRPLKRQEKITSNKLEIRNVIPWLRSSVTPGKMPPPEILALKERNKN
jgi:hypothetical protein